MLLLDIEEQTQSLSRQEKLKLFQYLEQELFSTDQNADTLPQADDDGLTLTAAPDGYEIQTSWSAFDAYEAAANLKAWEESLPGPKYLDPDKLTYSDEPVRELIPQRSSDA